MAISNPSGSTAFTHLINSEFITATLHTAVATPFVHEAAVVGVDMSGRATGTYAHPHISRMSAASAYSEGGEFSSTALSFVNDTTALGYVLQSTFVPEAVITRGITAESALAAAVNRVVDSVMQKMENDTMGLSSSLSNSTGSTATTNDLDNWNSVLTSYRAQSKSVNGATAFLHPDAIRDLHQDIVTSYAGLLGSSWGVDAAGTTGGVRQGLRAFLDGVLIYETDAIPASSTGWANFITSPDPANPGLVMPMSQPIRVRAQEPADALGVWVAAYADYGVGIGEEARSLRFVTRT